MSPISEPGPDAPQSLEAASAFAELEREVARRRTFAIISHPDAGKTTLTEKLLLYAGAIELAGAVAARKARRHATSDWMELEQQRGISITSAALEFELQGRRMSLLDTPGHQDFSEDTYRALIAADSVVMVIDAAKGVEDADAQALRGLPPRTGCRFSPSSTSSTGRRAIRSSCSTKSSARSASRPRRELADRQRRTTSAASTTSGHRTLLLLRARGAGAVSARRSSCRRSTIRTRERRLAQSVYAQFRESLDVIREAGTPFDVDEYRAGRQTPVFFGSALTNFGVEPFLQALVDLAPSPQPRPSDAGIVIADR